MKALHERLPELLLDAPPPAALDALVFERALAVFQRCARPSADVEGPARDRALDPLETSPLLSLLRS
jgi:hypothetical protein